MGDAEITRNGVCSGCQSLRALAPNSRISSALFPHRKYLSIIMDWRELRFCSEIHDAYICPNQFWCGSWMSCICEVFAPDPLAILLCNFVEGSPQFCRHDSLLIPPLKVVCIAEIARRQSSDRLRDYRD